MRRCVVFALAVVAAACSSARAAEPLPEPGPDVPLNGVITKTIHNAYDKDAPLLDQLSKHHVRSVELDIHMTKAGRAAPDADFFVYHADVPFLRKTSCSTFSRCLDQIAEFRRAVPDHDVLTLFVDLKDPFGPHHAPAHIDAALVRAFGRSSLVGPADLVARCPGAASVRDAVSGECRFPSFAELRGKVVVAVTGGTLCSPSSPTSQYRGAVAFRAPDLDGSCPIERYDEHRDTVFLNLAFRERRRAAGVRARGLIARVWGIGDALDFASARASGAHYLAIDQVGP